MITKKILWLAIFNKYIQFENIIQSVKDNSTSIFDVHQPLHRGSTDNGYIAF